MNSPPRPEAARTRDHATFFDMSAINKLRIGSHCCTSIILLQWSAVRVTAVTVTVGYSDSFGNPRFITNKTPLLTVTKNWLQ